MANKLKSSLEVFSKSIVQPLMYLSVAGTVLILGILLTNQTITSVVPFLQLPFFATMGKIIYNSLMFIVNNLAVIFCAGIAGAMGQEGQGPCDAHWPHVLLSVPECQQHHPRGARHAC